MVMYIIYPCIGLVVLFLLWIKVQNRFLLIPITFFAAVLINIPVLIAYLSMEFWPLWIVSTVGLTATYGLRFWKKEEKKVIEYLKFFGIILLPLAYYLVGISQRDMIQQWYLLILAIVFVIYFYDRVILRQQPINRTYVSILIVQTALLIVFFVYALVQRSQADAMMMRAVHAQQQAQQNAIFAQQQKVLAEKAAADCMSRSK